MCLSVFIAEREIQAKCHQFLSNRFIKVESIISIFHLQNKARSSDLSEHYIYIYTSLSH